MGKILDELLSELKDEELDTQVYKICNQIQDEEDKTYDRYAPNGANVFLAIEYFFNGQDIKFLALEREMPGRYFIGYWESSLVEEGVMPSRKRVKTIDVNDSKAEDVIKSFAKKLKFEKGVINE